MFFCFVCALQLEPTDSIIYKCQLEYNLSDPVQIFLVTEQFIQRCLLVFKHYSPGGDLSALHTQGGRHQGMQGNDNILLKGNNFLFSEISHSGIHMKKQHEASFFSSFYSVYASCGSIQKLASYFPDDKNTKAQTDTLLSSSNQLSKSGNIYVDFLTACNPEL